MEEETLNLTNEVMIRCAKCGAMLPESEFNRHRDGHQSYCRSCQSEYNRRYYMIECAERQAIREHMTLTDIMDIYATADRHTRRQYRDMLEGTIKRLKEIEDDRVRRGTEVPGKADADRADGRLF